MGTNTTKLGLRKPGENDFYNQQTEQADNWDKVDKFADDIQNDVDATWGGMYGGYIQDVSAKVVGQRYIDKINGKAYECIKIGSDINTDEFFRECTVKKNTEEINVLNKLSDVKSLTNGKASISFIKRGNVVSFEVTGFTSSTTDTIGTLPVGFRPIMTVRVSGYCTTLTGGDKTDNPTVIISKDGSVVVGGSSSWGAIQNIQIGSSFAV